MSSKKVVSKQRLQAVEVIMRESAYDAYGSFLSNFIVELITTKLPNELSFRYKIPAGLCNYATTASSKEKAYLPTSSALALFDEFSTYALVGADKSYRPGVSVHLSTDLVKPAYLNDEVLIVTKTDKIGKTMGFSTMEMYDTTGGLVAKGKHIKFMPLGFLWDLFTLPWLFPMALFVYNLLRGKKIKTCIDHLFSSDSTKKSSTVTNSHIADEIGDMFKALEVEKVSIITEFTSLPGHAENSAYYTVHAKKNMKNPLGSFHGGALAASLEDACRSYKDEICTEMKINPIVQSFDIRYLAAVKVKVLWF
jgi:acyl-coenzyme A thioesterase PaaI-like protein